MFSPRLSFLPREGQFSERTSKIPRNFALIKIPRNFYRVLLRPSFLPREGWFSKRTYISKPLVSIQSEIPRNFAIRKIPRNFSRVLSRLSFLPLEGQFSKRTSKIPRNFAIIKIPEEFLSRSSETILPSQGRMVLGENGLQTKGLKSQRNSLEFRSRSHENELLPLVGENRSQRERSKILGFSTPSQNSKF